MESVFPCANTLNSSQNNRSLNHLNGVRSRALNARGHRSFLPPPDDGLCLFPMPDELLHFAETDFEFAFLHPLPVGVNGVAQDGEIRVSNLLGHIPSV